MIQSLIIDLEALDRLGSALYDDNWFGTYLLPPSSQGLKRVQLGESAYILSDKADERSPLLVINVSKDGVFTRGVSPRHLFERILHVARATFEQRISINQKWSPYEEGSVLSIYSQPMAIAENVGQRTYFDRHPKGLSHIYAF